MTTQGKREHRWEIVFAGVLLFLMSGAIIPLASQGTPDFDINSVARDNVALRLTFLAGYIGMAALLVPQIRAFGDAAVRNPWVPILLLMIVTSVLWTSAPATTMQRGAGVVLTAGFGIYLATALPPGTVMRILVTVLGISMLLCALTIVFLPAYGDSALGWRGVYLFKNELGRSASLTALLAILLADSSSAGRTERWLLLVLAGLSFVLLVGSEARSALLVFLLVAGCYLLLRSPKRIEGLRSGLVMLGLSLVLFAFTLGVRPGDLFSLLGKDPDLTGRTPLWGYVWQSIERHPVIGYGYSGFWGGTKAPSSVIWEHVAWLPTHAHNGFLEVWLDLGALGLLLLALLMMTLVWRSLLCLERSRQVLPMFGLLFVVFLCASALTESVFLKSNTIYTCVLFYLAAAVSARTRHSQEHSKIELLEADPTGALKTSETSKEKAR